MQLKGYQQRTLDALRDYFQACEQFSSVSMAFYSVTESILGQGLSYMPVRELPGLPYVCLRIPTGGGKTVVAAHAVGITALELLHTQTPVILWLVPSNAIKEQTLKSFRNRDHHYRQALEDKFGMVNVLDTSEALSLQPSSMSSGLTLIVSTMQAFRVEDTEGRKVYEPSGALMGHFENLSIVTAARLDHYENGKPVTSLANVIRLHRPVVIVDEAHNARTGLSFETLKRFDPSCILEFTATPDKEKNPSNVLYTVSAAELKTDDMIKLPIRLETHTDWKTVISDAVATRNGLEAIAQQEQDLTGEYIRPIMLLQAQPKYKGKDTLTVEVLEKCLLEDNRIPPEQVRRATGEDNQIYGIDLLDVRCPVRYIITVQALREGWDCPFAYVLCSVAETYSATAIEQILGRVLRLPQANRKRNDELNLAYVFATSQNFVATLNSLGEALIQNGFEKQEVKDLIVNPKQPIPQAIDYGPLFNPTSEAHTVLIKVDEKPALHKLAESTSSKVSYDATSQIIEILEPLAEEEVQALEECFTTLAARQAVINASSKIQASVVKTYKPTTPLELKVPVLCYRQGNVVSQFEETHIADFGWDLVGRDALLSEAEFPTNPPEGQQAEIDISQEGKVKTRFLADLQLDLQLLDADRNWELSDLVYWLDQAIQHYDLEMEQSVPFLTRMVQGLIRDRKLPLDLLVKDKYRLKKSADAKITAYRKAAKKETFNHLLIGIDSRMVVTPEKVLSYDPDPMHYPYPAINSLFPQQHTFKKHFYPTVGDLRPEGEEFQCAQLLDNLSKVETWVRNLERRPEHSFWLQTSSDKFYPDFVCKLTDGRYLVVEYKGEHLWSAPDAQEKKTIGEVWEKRSEGSCLFVMPKGPDWNAILAKVA